MPSMTQITALALKSTLPLAFLLPTTSRYKFIQLQSKIFQPSHRPVFSSLAVKTTVTSISIPTAKSRRRCSVNDGEQEVLLEGMPPEYYDDEWQAKEREKTTKLRRMQREEDEEEERKVEEYREIGTRWKEFPEEDLRKARNLVSSFITAAQEVEEVTLKLIDLYGRMFGC
ncbi:unnamed protein product [Cochlearia groenlandica]